MGKKEILLDFDQVAKVSLKFFQYNHYEKVFHVVKNGVDFDWAGITELILQVKKDVNAPAKILELKLSAGDFIKTTGYLRLILPNAKTKIIPPGTYSNVELLIVFSSNRDRIWWAGGQCECLKRGIAEHG